MGGQLVTEAGDTGIEKRMNDKHVGWEYSYIVLLGIRMDPEIQASRVENRRN